jgi:uncharacterized protein (TIGR03437 family)
MAMKHLIRSLLYSAAAVAAFAQPSITPNGVVNGASYTTPIARGSIVVIFGKGLGPAALVQATTTPLPVQLPSGNGTSVKFSSGGGSYDGVMLYTSATQVSAIVPSTVPTGTASVTVTYAGQTSAAVTVPVVNSAFGAFTKNSSGAGPVIAQNFVSATSTPLNGLSQSAQPGQVIILYGTGLGAISAADNVPPPVANVGSGVQIVVGGQTIAPLYAGRAPQFPGLDQINFQLPGGTSKAAAAGETVATGCYVPVTIQTSGGASNQTTMSIASGSPDCVHPMGVTHTGLVSLDNGGKIKLGLLLLARLSILGFQADAAAGAFFEGDANTAFTASLQAGGTTYPIAVGSCIVIDQITGAGTPSTPGVGGIANARLLDAGPALTLTGGSTRPMPGSQGGYQTSGLDQFLTPGTWSIGGSGGPDVGAFKATVNVGSLIAWTNASQYDGQTIPRGALTITWSGGTGDDVVGIAGSSTLTDTLNPANTRGKQFNCNAAAKDNTFTVPANIVQQLIAAPTPLSAGQLFVGTLSIGTGNGTTFSGGGLDGGVIAWSDGDSRLVSWK